jgi:S-adenosyl-L-methionine methyltransferase
MTRSISRLEKLYFRLEAQNACLAWTLEKMSSHPGVVFEIGLGQGRTYDHLRRYLPGRDIFVFDRQIKSYPDCTPDAEHLLLGDLSVTLPQAASRFAGKVILAHSDVGSFSAEGNVAISGLVSALLMPALADGAFILSDLPLAIPNALPLPLPAGAREDHYYLYRFSRK